MNIEEAMEVIRSLPEFEDENSEVFDAYYAIVEELAHLESRLERCEMFSF